MKMSTEERARLQQREICVSVICFEMLQGIGMKLSRMEIKIYHRIDCEQVEIETYIFPSTKEKLLLKLFKRHFGKLDSKSKMPDTN